jgi:hypothetical protein
VKACGSKETLFALERGRADILDQNEHGAIARLGDQGQTPDRFRPAWPLEDLTFLGALRLDQLTAPCVFDGRSMASASELMSNRS